MINGMKETVEYLRKNPEKQFTMGDIIEENLFPGAKDGRTLRKLIAADLRGGNTLKVQITGEGGSRRYLFTAKNITKFLQVYGPGLNALSRKRDYAKSKKRSKKS